MRTLVSLGLLLAAAPALAQSLSFSGDCPGAVTIDVTGMTPGGTAVFLAGTAGEGSDVIGVGSCVGTETGLAGVRFLFRAVDDDGDGALSFTPDIPDGRCDAVIQVLDVAACAMTNTDTATGGGAIDNGLGGFYDPPGPDEAANAMAACESFHGVGNCCNDGCGSCNEKGYHLCGAPNCNGSVYWNYDNDNQDMSCGWVDPDEILICTDGETWMQ